MLIRTMNWTLTHNVFVGVTDIVGVTDDVIVGVIDGVIDGVTDIVGVIVGVTDGVIVGVSVGVIETHEFQ